MLLSTGKGEGFLTVNCIPLEGFDLYCWSTPQLLHRLSHYTLTRPICGLKLNLPKRMGGLNIGAKKLAKERKLLLHQLTDNFLSIQILLQELTL